MVLLNRERLLVREQAMDSRLGESCYVDRLTEATSKGKPMDQSDSILVTGGFGCIGAQTVKWLLANTDTQVIVGSRRVSEQRIQRLFGDDERPRLTCVQMDVTDQDQLEELMNEHAVNRVVHLAALQTPDCNSHRDLGLQINLAGTQNVIEAMKACELPIERFAFASSIAVYGARSHYSGEKVPMLAEPAPVNVYGAWKLAGENIARMFCEETDTPTVSLRPGVLFGPGRDAGLTSTPTTAMKHVVLGQAYEIPFCSRQDYLFAADVGAAFGNAVMAPFSGYATFTLPSHTVTTNQLVVEMKSQAAKVGLSDSFNITVGHEEVPFICDLEFAAFLEAFPQSPHTPLAEAIRISLEEFIIQKQKGWLDG